MKKSRNVYPVDKSGTKHEKHNNTKRYPHAVESSASKKNSPAPAAPKQNQS